MITSLVDCFRLGKSLLSEEVREQVTFRCRGNKDRRYPGKMLVKQHPVEAMSFLDWMRTKKIVRYAEVGCFNGGMLCVVDSFLRANFQGVVTIGVDIRNRLVGYDEYQRISPRCEFQQVQENQWVPDERQDVVFIDTNQGTDATKAEATRLRGFTDYIAFHDVDDKRWGTSSFWYGGEADLWGKEAYFHYGDPLEGGPGIGVVRCIPSNRV